MTALPLPHPLPHHVSTAVFSLEGSNVPQDRGLPWSAPQLAAAAVKAIDILLKVASMAANPVEARRAASAVLRFIQASGVLQAPRLAATAAPARTGPQATGAGQPPSSTQSQAGPGHAEIGVPSSASATSTACGIGPVEGTAAVPLRAPPLLNAVQRLLDAAGSMRRREAG